MNRMDFDNLRPYDSGEIVKTEYGSLWCDKIREFEDSSYRLERGRKYFRSCLVSEMKLINNEIIAVVNSSYIQGSSYNINIVFDVLDEENKLEINTLMKLYEGHNYIDNTSEKMDFNLINNILIEKSNIIFPSIDEIHFSCNCPDNAKMCKHIAAVLYALAHELDFNPLLIYYLRCNGELDTKEEIFSKYLTENSTKELKFNDLISQDRIIFDNKKVNELFDIRD